MQQRQGYSKAVLGFPLPARRAVPASAAPAAPEPRHYRTEENIVAAAFARYIAGCESADRASPGGVAPPSRIIGSLFACRRTGPQRRAVQIV
jgi:hypothetical protein